MITKEVKTLTSGPLIIPSYLAKGLEFDTVLICDCSRAVYCTPEELPILYTVCTRALHQLFLYYTGEPPRSYPDQPGSLRQERLIRNRPAYLLKQRSVFSLINPADLGIQIPAVLVPAAQVDLNKWAVIACDQYTSNPEYWAEVTKTRLVLPLPLWI